MSKWVLMADHGTSLQKIWKSVIIQIWIRRDELFDSTDVGTFGKVVVYMLRNKNSLKVLFFQLEVIYIATSYHTFLTWWSNPKCCCYLLHRPRLWAFGKFTQDNPRLLISCQISMKLHVQYYICVGQYSQATLSWLKLRVVFSCITYILSLW